MTDTPETELEFVTLHRVKLEGGKFGWAVAPAALAEADVPESAQSYFPAGKSRLLPGAIYCSSGLVGEDGRIRRLGIGHARFVRRVAGDHASVWRIKDEAVDAEAQSERLERKVRSTPALAAEVRQLAALYRRLSYREQAAFHNAVMGAIIAEARKAKRG